MIKHIFLCFLNLAKNHSLLNWISKTMQDAKGSPRKAEKIVVLTWGHLLQDC